MGSVSIHRDRRGWRDLLRAYKVEIDGTVVGKIRRGETMRHDLSPGRHVVRLKIDWCASREVALDGAADERLICGPGGGPFAALANVVAWPDEYIILCRETEL